VDEFAVNRQARHAYAEVLRHFAAGRLTTDQYENALVEIERRYGTDAAIRRIFDVVWLCYDDLITHRMIGGHRLNTQARRYVAQAVLFLRAGNCEKACELPDAACPPPNDGPTILEQLIGLIWIWDWVGWAVGFLAFYYGRPEFLPVAVFSVVGARLVHWWDVSRSSSREPKPSDAAKPFEVVSPWPFPSREALSRARARATYLYA